MERRQFPRLGGKIPARILINKMHNAEARVLELSAGGLRFEYDGIIDIGDDVVALLEGGARLEGRVVRTFESGFAISLSLSENKRKRLSLSLERAMAASAAIDRLTLERRFTARVSGMRPTVDCETESGLIKAQIIDMSLTGVAIATEAELEIDSLIVVGRMRGQVLRREGEVYGVKFLSSEVAPAGAAAPDDAKMQRRRA